MTALTGMGCPATLKVRDAALSPRMRERISNLIHQMAIEDIGGCIPSWWYMAQSHNALPDGVLVNVVGTRLSGQMALEGSAYAIAPGDLGLARDAFLVGNSLVERSIRLGGGDVTPFRDTLIVVGLFLVAMAAVSYVHGRRHLVLGASEPAPASASQSPKTPKAFQPLASQDEIRKTDQAERARRRRSKLSFATSFSGDPVAALKNPR